MATVIARIDSLGGMPLGNPNHVHRGIRMTAA
jgi:hypothetical protein